MDRILEKYKQVPMYKMTDNKPGGHPFFVAKYAMSNNTTTLHRHEFLQINYVNMGKGIHVVNNHEFNIVRGDIFVIPPYVPHEIKTREGEET